MPTIVVASDSVKLSIGQWGFEKLNAHNLSVDLVFTPKGIGFIASAESMQLAQPIGKISQVKLNCKTLVIVSEEYACARGNVAFNQKDIGSQKLAFEMEAIPDSEKYKVEIENLKLASALFSVTVIIKNDKWKIFADTPQLDLTSLTDFLTPYLKAEQLSQLTNWNIAGEVKLDIDLLGEGELLNKIGLDLVSKDTNISDSEGRYVSEGLISTWAIEAERIGKEWQWQSALNATTGQVYVDPVYLDFSTTALTIDAEGSYLQGTDEAKVVVSKAKMVQQGVTEVDASGSGSFSQLSNLKVNVKNSELENFYSTWIQPFVVGTAFDNIEVAGQVNFHYEKQDEKYHISMGLDEVFIDDKAQRFGMDDVSGIVAWSNYEIAQSLTLQWQRAYVYAIPLGGATINAQTYNSSLFLNEPWHLPVLDGVLKLNTFSLHNPGDERLKWSFEGELSPISMESLSTALEWPLMHGKLSGTIPNVSYVDQQIHSEGALRMNVFEGVTTISDLRLEKPFGALPQLHVNIDMKGLNLETLTETFDFGRITGKLDGKVSDFRLSNWQAVHFDAQFKTPDGDKSRRKISQKAVDSLSQIGGGASGIIQRSFLRFFEDFSYQRLGLNCKLRNNVCEMSGVGKAKQGYYIVKGGGLPPRINVVGYTQRVDWPDLIERLKAVSDSPGPVIK